MGQLSTLALAYAERFVICSKHKAKHNTKTQLNWPSRSTARPPHSAPNSSCAAHLHLKVAKFCCTHTHNVHTHTYTQFCKASKWKCKCEFGIWIQIQNQIEVQSRQSIQWSHFASLPLIFLFRCLLPCYATAFSSTSPSSSSTSSWSLLHLCSILFLSPLRLDCRFSCNFCISRCSQSCTYLRQTLVYPVGFLGVRGFR